MAEDGRPLTVVSDRAGTAAWASVEDAIDDCIESSRRSGRVSLAATIVLTMAAVIMIALACRQLWPPRVLTPAGAVSTQAQ